MKIITSQTILSRSDVPAEQFKQEMLQLGKKLAKEERRLALQAARARRYAEKRDSHAIAKPLIDNDLRDSHGERDSHAKRDSHAIAKPLIDNDLRDSHGVIFTLPIISKKESKKESKNRDSRVSTKRSQIPIDLICSEKNVSDAISIGVPPELVENEWQQWHDHHLAKATLGSDWDASFRNWCRNFVKWNKNKPQSGAKPLTFREASIIGNRRRALDLAENPFIDTFLKPNEIPETALGGPTPRLVSPNGHAGPGRNVQGNGDFDGGLFGKGSG